MKIRTTLPFLRCFARCATLAMVVGCTGVVDGELRGGAPQQAPPSSTDGPLSPAVLESACTEDAPWPRRIIRLSAGELVRTFATFGGVDTSALPNSLKSSGVPEQPTASLTVTRDFHQDVDKLATQLAQSFVAALECDVAHFGADAACTEAFLNQEVVRLLRGKRDAETLAGLGRLAATVATNSGGAQALEYTVRAALLSPASLYMTEGFDETRSASGKRRLSPAELASYLSYRLTGGPPSAALLERLQAQPDVDAKQLRHLVQGELVSGKGELVRRFLSSYLHVADIGTLARNPDKFPDADATFMTRLQGETLAALATLAESGGTFESLLTREHHSALLADDASAAYARWGRPGVFALPGVIAVASSGNHTNIPRRGRLLLDNLFCEALQSPPPGATAAEPPGVEGEGQRTRFERVGQVAGCGNCHARMHPFGFAFEAYDEIGSPRERDEHGNAVHVAAEFLPDGADTPLSFTDPRGLMAQVATSEIAQSCFVMHNFRYVARRTERGSADACVLKELVQSSRARDFDLADLAESALIATALAERAD